MKGITWALIIFFVMFIGDMVSTLINSSLVQHLEANPIYQYTGIAGIAVLNLGVAVVFYYCYKHTKSLHTRHAYIFALVLISVLRIFIIYSNIQVYLHPPTLAQAMSITQAVKTKFYLIKVVQPMVMAFIPAWISFGLFAKDHQMEAKK